MSSHRFDFSFVAPNRKRRTKPQLVFTFDQRHLPEVETRLVILSSRWAVEYYLGKPVEFALPRPDLFGRMECGYDRCAIVTFEGENVSFRLELEAKQLSAITATIALFTSALDAPFELVQVRSNRVQQIELTTRCENESMGWDHAIGGYISSEVRSWLRRKSTHLDEKKWANEASPEIVAAMRQAWKAVVPKSSREWARDCRARIATDGRFILECMGNACDVAIDPGSMEIENDVTEFGCHNLDQARQQVTLLAGLAKLCEIVRRDEV